MNKINEGRALEVNTIHLGDCLELMKNIPNGSIDLIVCDLPYAVTNCKWDNLVPFDPLWAQYKRITKENAAICLFGCQPFSSFVVMSNLKWFRHEIIWDKKVGSNFQHANKMIMKSHENVSMFYKKLPTYNPQKTKGKPYHVKASVRTYGIDSLRDMTDNEKKTVEQGLNTKNVAQFRPETKNDGTRFPLSVQYFKRDTSRWLPTQKPVALYNWLIKTYSNEGDLVLDNCAGSGTIAISAHETNRNYIGMEKSEENYKISQERIKKEIGKEI